MCWPKHKLDYTQTLKKPTDDYLWNEPGCVLSCDSAEHLDQPHKEDSIVFFLCLSETISFACFTYKNKRERIISIQIMSIFFLCLGETICFIGFT